jgi:hypothetical protein
MFRFYSESELAKCEMKGSGPLIGGKPFDTVLDFSEGHTFYGKALHSTLVVAASERGTLNASVTLALARPLNLLTRDTALLLYDNSTRHKQVDSTTVDIPILNVGMSSLTQNRDDDEQLKWYDSGEGEEEAMIEIVPIPTVEVRLVECQSASGDWGDLAGVCALLGKVEPHEKWPANAIATALAVIHLRRGGKGEFALSAEKGEIWLRRQLGGDEALLILTWAETL